MKVFCFSRADADVPQRQALCVWHRVWKDHGFEPMVVTPEHGSQFDLSGILKASQQHEEVFARWTAPYRPGNQTGQALLVGADILPIINADQMPKSGKDSFVRYDTSGRVIYIQRQSQQKLEAFLGEYVRFSRRLKGAPFTDWDLILLDHPKAPTIDRVLGPDPHEIDWFVSWTQEQMLEMRKAML